MGGVSKGGENSPSYSDCLSHFLEFSVVSKAAGLWLLEDLGGRTRSRDNFPSYFSRGKIQLIQILFSFSGNM